MTITSDAPLRCAAHPAVETYLRCGKCDKPICPKCLVYTPVGTRCSSCAQLKALPTYQVGVRHIVLATLAGLSLALVGGVVWTFFRVGAFFLFWILPLYGLLVAEVVSRSANRKRGTVLASIAAASIVLTYIVSRLLPLVLLMVSRGASQAALQNSLFAGLLDPISIVIVVIACALAVSRLR